MSVIGGRQATIKTNNAKKETPGVKKVVRNNKPKVEEEVKPVEEPKVEVTETNTSNSLSTIKPIKRKPHLNSTILDQLSKSNITVSESKPEPVQTSETKGNPVDFNALADMIVTRMDDEFVSKNELESLVKTMVEKVLQEMLVDPNKKGNVNRTTVTRNNSTIGTKMQTKVIGRKK